jgi:hypothetical protein
MTETVPDSIEATLEEAALSDLLKLFDPDPQALGALQTQIEAILKQEAGLSELLKPFDPDPQALGALQTQITTDPIGESLLKLSLENFGSGAAQPAGESSFALHSADFSQFSTGATASTNPKIALAEALHPGVPVFG